MNIKYCLILGIAMIVFACQSDAPKAEKEIRYRELRGKTMGTSYVVKYLDSLERDFQVAIDRLLVEVNSEVSTYEPESFISRFNKSDSEIKYLNILKPKEKFPRHFKANFEKSKEVFKNSFGAFDPTIMPIVNYWGFGYTEKRPVVQADVTTVDSLMNFVGFDKITQRSTENGWIYINKEDAGIQLDFSAIAKGYGVDAVAELLISKGISNLYVEIGGELIVKGKNPQNNWWTIGINVPSDDAGLTDLQAKVALQNQAMATSGNYRNFYEVDGVKYAHTINTKTGFPEKNTLLSASIFAKDCMTADAYATACMSMGLEKAGNMIKELNDIEAYFLYSDDNGQIKAQSTSSTLNIITQ